jgi:SsrA-binding protein
MAKHKKKADNLIADNRKARHDYSLFEQFEAGLVLSGWEVKSIRAGKVQLRDSFISMRQGEAWLVQAHISPLITASTHVEANPTRARKCLLHVKELKKCLGAVQEQGQTLVPTALCWRRGRVKVKFAVARGKKMYDKRHDLKQKEATRAMQRAVKQRF